MSHHPSWLCRQAALAVCAAGAFVSYSYCTIAATNEDIGRAPLADKLGAALPTGVGVPVMQVEAVFEGGTLMELDPEFLGKTLTMRTPIAAAGWHALNVGKIFYGLNSSIAPGITQIELYDTNGLNGFMGPGLLNAGAGTNPLVSSQHSRVANHSWVGRTMEPLDVLERVDWLVERDDMVHVVAVHNISGLINPLLSNSMNSISVGVSNGNHETVALSLGGIYTANRTRPEIVAPAGATSFAAPMISAAAATLIGVGHSQPALSQNQFYKSPRTGEIIYHAETSEVIKAALLAGASRQAFNSDGSIIYGYRGAASTESDNGLDTRYGAGQVNLQNSYFILAAGEQKSLQDGGRALNSADGFHYDANFGGANGSNSTATYDFVAGWTGQTLTASLAWNAKIDMVKTQAAKYTSAATLNNLDLAVYDVTNANQPILVRASNSGEQNTENLWSNLIGGHRYRLQVNGTADQGQFDSDYGLAWSTTGTIGWTGSSGNAWQNSGQANFVRGQSGSVYDDYEHVVFNDHADASRTNISVQGSPTPASILVDNSTRDYSFNDGPIGQTPAGLIKRGTGTLTLNSHNLHIGKNHIESGTVVVTADQALGSTAAQTIVSSGAALAFRSVNYTAAEPVSVSGNGPTGRGAIENQAGNSSFAGPVTVTSSSGIGVTGGSLAITGNLSVDASQTATKLGSGTLAMRGGHTLSHNSRLFVQAGSVILAPEASSPVSIAAQGAALQIGNAGAVVIDASRRDPLSDSSVRTQRVSVINDSATGLTVSAGMTAANEITGRGNTFVSAGASLQADRIEQNALLIGSAAKVELRNSSAGGTASLVQSLVIDGGSRPTGLLDLANNDLVISATNATKNTVLSTTVQQILFSQNKTGAHSHWDRAGISTSTAAAINSSAGGELLGLAAIRNSDFLTVGMSAEDSFSGLPVDSDDILVKYTFLGDANLDGLIDMDDYGLIDAIMRGIRPNLGWISGDFNYDGSVDFDDYGLIDFAFGMQNAILLEESVGAVSLSAPATTHQAATLASFLNSDATLVVPEPETWLLLGIGCVTIGIAALARRRRVSSQ